MKPLKFYLFGILLSLATTVFVKDALAEQSNFNTSQIKQIEQITHDYIINNPQTIIESIKKLQGEEIKKETVKIKQSVEKYNKEVFDANLPGRVSIGNSNGNIIMTEFFSYQCPNCRMMEPAVDKLIKDNPSLKVIFVGWPFENADDAYAAQNTLAAQKQGKFYELHQALMSYPSLLTKESIDKLAQSIKGLDIDKLKRDAEENSIQEGIKDNFKLAQKVGFEGTPVFMFTNKNRTKFSVVPGRSSYDDLQNAINEVK